MTAISKLAGLERFMKVMTNIKLQISNEAQMFEFKIKKL